MKHIYFNELTVADSDADIIRQLDVFRNAWKDLSIILPLKNNLFALPSVIQRLVAAVGTIGSGKIGPVRKETMQSFLLGSFHPETIPIDDEPDSSPETVSRFLSSKWSVATEAGHSIKCLMLAWSHLRGSLTIGFHASGVWKRCVVQIEETTPSEETTPRTAICVSRTEHAFIPIVSRWLYCFADSEHMPEHPGFSYDIHGYKHFKLASYGEADPVVRHWVESTRSPGEALFRPGLRHDSPEISTLIRKALACAFESGFYESYEVNGYEIESCGCVGAANGKRTKKIRLYITPQNDLHLRPKE